MSDAATCEGYGPPDERGLTMNAEELYEKFGIRRTVTRSTRRNDVPEGIVRITDVKRDVVEQITKHNDAYLLHDVSPGTDDLTPDELYTCAGSLRVAKKVAREHHAGNEELSGPWRWIEETWGWKLECTHTEVTERDEDEYDEITRGVVR